MKTCSLLRFFRLLFVLLCLQASAFAEPHSQTPPAGTSPPQTQNETPSRESPAENPGVTASRLQPADETLPAKDTPETIAQRRERRREARQLALMMLGFTKSSARGR